MRKLIPVLLIVVLAMLNSCVPSLQPIYYKQDIIFVEEVLGTWTDEENENTFEITKLDDFTYKLIYTDESKKTGTFHMRMTEIDGKMFMDIFPARLEMEENYFYQMLMYLFNLEF